MIQRDFFFNRYCRKLHKNYNEVRIQQKLGYLSPIEYRELAA
ncbi:IS3 family transposase [Mammaliicoccus vitulinus]